MRRTVFYRLVCCIAAFALLLPIAACGQGDKDKVRQDGKTINVKCYKAGYGADYIYEMKEAFEKAYKDEGYEVNILTPARDIQGSSVLQEIYIDAGIDVYFTNNVTLNAALNGTYGQCFSDITESVFNRAPLKLDGTEEEGTVAEKLKAGTLYDIFDEEGNVYGLPYVEGIGGLVVNKTVLESYGLALPKTTNELFNCYSKIMETAFDTGVYPYTLINSSSNYPAHLTNMWMAQYAGSDWLDSFWSFSEDGTDRLEDGYAYFAHDAVYEMLKCLYEAFDYMAAALGSSTQDIPTAQAQVTRGTAVFMSTGDYFFKEQSLSFSSRLKDVTIIQVPVISALGTKLFGAGTDYNRNAADCEAILREIIDLVDENKAVDEIVSAIGQTFGFTPSAETVEAVCKARGATYNRTTFCNAYISEKSPVKDIAALFLRMCAGTEGATVIAQNTYSSNPFTSGQVHSQSEYEFLRSAERIINNRYLNYHEASATGLRLKLGLDTVFPQTGQYVHQKIYQEQKTIYNARGAVIADKAVYSNAARALADQIATHAANNWPTWRTSAGLN